MTFTQTMRSAMASPVIVGGTGGSGTRCLAGIIVEADGYLGWDLNISYDSLSLAPFLRRHMLEAYDHVENLFPGQIERWKVDFASVIFTHLLNYGGQQIWGWKNPTSMFLVPFFNEVFPSLKFLHLVRDGRDMALSENSNQYSIFNHGDCNIDIEKKAKFWSMSNTKVKKFATRYLKDNYLLVRFEDLCNDPGGQIESILNFVGSSSPIDACLQAVRKPDSIGRFQTLPGREIQRLTAAAKDGLIEFGYV